MDFSRLRSLAISDSGFVFDPTTGHSFTTNSVGIAIISALKNGIEPEAIAAQLTEQYNVSHDEAESDVSDFIDCLKKFMLV